jgi:hypothetical protein
VAFDESQIQGIELTDDDDAVVATVTRTEDGWVYREHPVEAPGDDEPAGSTTDLPVADGDVAAFLGERWPTQHIGSVAVGGLSPEDAARLLEPAAHWFDEDDELVVNGISFIATAHGFRQE